MSRRWAVGAGFLLLPGCSLLVDWPSFTAARGGDGGDARVDVPTSDAATGGTDAQTEAAAPTRFCEGLAAAPGFRFCADFDGPNDDGGPAAEWESATLADGGELSLDSARFFSAPRALHATSRLGNAVSTDGTGPPAHARVMVAFDYMTLSTPSTGAAVCVFALQQKGSPYSSVYFYFNADQTYVQTVDQAGASQFSDRGPPPAVGAWHHGSVSLDQTANTISATLDGAPLMTQVANQHPWTQSVEFAFSAGLPALYESMTGEVVVDDVVVEAQ